jgi:1-acyl-sn-glycerol-3-phosphate acyltransferase
VLLELSDGLFDERFEGRDIGEGGRTDGELRGAGHRCFHGIAADALCWGGMWAGLRMLFVFIVLGTPAALVGIPWSALGGDFRTIYGWGMGIIRLGVRFAGIRVRLEGMENIPVGRACIFLSNHVSNLDPPVLLPSIPGMTSVFLKRSLMKIPLLGTAMRMGKFVPVARGHSREEAEKSVAAAAEALHSGLHVTIFPEGTRSPDGRLLAFKQGAFFLAEETGASMVPVVIQGTAQMMRKGSLKIYPGEALVRFLPAVWPKNFASREEMMAAVRAEMEKALLKNL